MLDAATRAAEDEERIGRIQREEQIRDQETRKAMAMTGGTMVLQYRQCKTNSQQKVRQIHVDIYQQDKNHRL